MCLSVYFLCVLLLQQLTSDIVHTPDENREPRWDMYEMVDGTARMRSIVDYYQEFHKEYYDACPELMDLLRERYQDYLGRLENNAVESYSSIVLSDRILLQIQAVCQSDWPGSSFNVRGCRDINRNAKYLFDRIYGWYLYGYGDGNYFTVWSDEDLFRKLDVGKSKIEKASLLVECWIDVEEMIDGEYNVYQECVLFYFDEKEDYLFKIHRCS